MLFHGNKQSGFGLIMIILAVAIIALLYFGTRGQKGRVEQNLDIKNKAVDDLGGISEKLKESNQKILDEM